ncbi:MAG: CCA tRNA nucleotidyltransferase [Gemmataceae bacterium]
MTEREFAVDVVKRLRDAGHEALWAGGCVRDELLGLVPKDYDIATDARPERVRKLFRRTVAVGVSFGVVKVLGPKPLEAEVVTFRSDTTYSDGRHPDAVVFSSAREDALRRDFTINGMFFDPVQNEVIDYVGGREDLERKLLRSIGDPYARFAEDKLRLLRAARLATRFGLAIEPATLAAMKEMAAQIHVVSAERIADEFRKLLVQPRRTDGLRLLDEVGLLEPIMPELIPMQGLPQGPPAASTGDLWEHVLRVLDLIGDEISFPLALATLLHDVGKPRTVGLTPERYTFYYHEHVGRRLADEICRRLKLSNAERERVAWLVEKHQYLCDAPKMRDSKLKVMLMHEGIDELLELHRADAEASSRSIEHVEFCRQRLREWSDSDINPRQLITGDDLREMGVPPGPEYKRILDAVREAQLDGTVTTREQALALVRRLLGFEGSP